MADFPIARFHLPVISSWSAESTGARIITDTSTGSSVAIGANTAYYVPLALSAPYLVQKLWWANGTTANGNMDVAVYTQDGTLILNTTPTVAQTGTTVIQSVAPQQGATLVLPGSYYMAVESSSATGTLMRVQPTVVGCQLAGAAQQSVTFPLPATFTLATKSGQTIPLFGIASSTVI